jgi:hypothetical protein
MPRAKKRASKRSKKQRSKASKRVVKKRKAAARSSFSRIWKKLGDDILGAVEKELGWNRKAFVARLASDPEFRRLLVQRAIPVPMTASLEKKDAGLTRLPEPAARGRDEELVNEYASRAQSATSWGITEDDRSPEEEKADWRLT